MSAAADPSLVNVEIELRQEEYDILRTYADRASTTAAALITILLIMCIENPRLISRVMEVKEAGAVLGPLDLALLTGWPWKKMK